jgi:hypothetical protein
MDSNLIVPEYIMLEEDPRANALYVFQACSEAVLNRKAPSTLGSSIMYKHEKMFKT